LVATTLRLTGHLLFGEAVCETGREFSVYGLTHSIHGRRVYGAVQVATGTGANDTVSGEFLYYGLCMVDQNLQARPDILVAGRNGVN